MANLVILCIHNHNLRCFYKGTTGASQVAQWERIHLPTQAHGSDPWSRKIPPAWEQLGVCAVTTEPPCHRGRAPRQEEPVQRARGARPLN